MKKLKTAVVGVGYLGQYHTEKYSFLPQSELIAVCDIDHRRCQEIASKFHIKAIDDYRMLIGQVDAVSIAVPTILHHKIGKFFLENGIHVLLEKPIATDLQEARDLINIANRNNLILQIGHIERFNSAITAIKPLLNHPLFVESSRLAPFKLRGSDVSVILDLMIHDIDIIQSIVKSEIIEIRATGAAVLTPLVDIANARIEFENGSAANLSVSRVSLKAERKLRIFQPDNYLSLDLNNKTLSIHRKSKQEMFPNIPEIESLHHTFENSDALRDQIESFLSAIIDSQSPVVNGEDGFRALATALQISEHIQHKWMRVQKHIQHTSIEEALVEQSQAARAMISPATKRIFIVTGEASGDLLGTQLVNAIREDYPSIDVLAMGGPQLKAAGAQIVIDSTQLAVVGFDGILTHLKKIIRALRQIKTLLKKTPPDLVILIDYPDFNLRVAKMAKKLNIPVLYYVSPQIWAWRYGRIKNIKRDIDHMAVLFPFEEEIYKKENVPVTFVGHPLVNMAKSSLSADEAYQRWNLNKDHPIIALFPGSRQHEIKRILPTIMQSVALIRKKIPQAQFVLPLAKNLHESHVQEYLTPDIIIIQNQNHDILPICTAAIAASGTVTLEIAIHQVPMVIVYKVTLASALLFFFAVKIKHVGLCNIISNELVAKELLQYDATPEAIAAETIQLIENSHYRDDIISKLSAIKAKLGHGDSSKNTARVALEMLGQRC